MEEWPLVAGFRRGFHVRVLPADGSGGGIYNDGGLTLINSTISGNVADSGGGVSNAGGTLRLINSTISDNRAQRPGGGILNGGTIAQTEMFFCTVYGNTSSESGGVIWNGITNSASQLVIRNSLVAGNKAPAVARAISAMRQERVTGLRMRVSSLTWPESVGTSRELSMP